MKSNLSIKPHQKTVLQKSLSLRHSPSHSQSSETVRHALYYNYWGKAQHNIVARNDENKAVNFQDLVSAAASTSVSSFCSPSYHLLVYHSLDVAAVGQVFLRQHPLVLGKLSGLTGLAHDEFVKLFSFFLALHDVGKFAESFQNLNPDAAQTLDPHRDRRRQYKEKHDTLGWRLWHECLKDGCSVCPVTSPRAFQDEVDTPIDARAQQAMQAAQWQQAVEGDTAVDVFINVVTGHHGKPPDTNSGRSLDNDFSPDDQKAALMFLNDLVPLFELQDQKFPSLEAEQVKLASWWLNGVAVLSDWLGSNTQYFPYDTQVKPLSQYWLQAQQNAHRAVDDVGIIKQKPATQFKLTNIIKGAQPNPLQKACIDWPIGSNLELNLRSDESTLVYNKNPISPAPELFILEDVTGSGKTEAAILLAHKLMQANLGAGVFFALPTMATSNAMHQRVAKFYRHLFKPKASGAAPSFVLAHSKSKWMPFLNKMAPASAGTTASTATVSVATEPAASAGSALAGTVKMSASAPDKVSDQVLDFNYSSNEITASSHCNEWLSDNRKKSLLADVGVGTIDQALLSILPAKHQSLRLLGLMNKIIIVDEVHACDAYMNQLLCQLLEAQSRVGGSVILLSATLPHNQKQKLIQSYAKPYKDMSKMASSSSTSGTTASSASTSGATVLSDAASRASTSTTSTVKASSFTQARYPLITNFNAHGLTEQSVEAATTRKLNVQFLKQEDDVLTLIKTKAEQGACVCWIRNTIYDALDAYNKIKSYYPKTTSNKSNKQVVDLFHSRYALGDRLNIEQATLHNFGKTSTSKQRKGRVLIATQVVEQSLDLDFDVLISDLAPIDLLLQRAGRLQRHKRDRHGNPTTRRNAVSHDTCAGPSYDERPPACLYIYGPEFVHDVPANWYKHVLPKAAYVYPNHAQLWLTARALQNIKGQNIKGHNIKDQNTKSLCVPADMRDLIESVYSDAAQLDVPKGLQKSGAEAEGQAVAKSAQAQIQALEFKWGYQKKGIPWWDEGRTLTRLGADSKTVYLVRWRQGQLVPWVEFNSTTSSPLESAAQWFMSAVSVPAHWAQQEGQYDEFSQATIETCRQTLPDKGKWSVLLPLVESEGRWLGQTLGAPDKNNKIKVQPFEYSSHKGLVHLSQCHSDAAG